MEIKMLSYSMERSMFHWRWIKPNPSAWSPISKALGSDSSGWCRWSSPLSPITPLSNALATKVPGPKLGPCLEVASLREASVGPLLFLPASQMVFWNYALDAVTKVTGTELV